MDHSEELLSQAEALAALDLLRVAMAECVCHRPLQCTKEMLITRGVTTKAGVQENSLI